MIYACHCSNCQRIAGSAFGLAANVRESSLEFTSGEPARVTWESDAGNERYGSFCGDCGCRIAHGQTDSIGILSLRAGTFDDTSWVNGGTFADITSVGVATMNLNQLKEELRFCFTYSGGARGNGVHLLLSKPAWRDY